MKISMMTYTMARGEWGKNSDIKELCQFTNELNIEGIDWVTTYGKDPVEIKKVTDDFGLKNICHTFHADIQYPTKEERKQGLEEVKKGLEAAKKLGADKIMIPLPGLEEVPREETRKYAIEGLSKAVELGKKQDITITIEHFPGANSPFVTSSDVNEAIKQIPDLYITYDNGNVYTGGEEPAAGFVNSKEHIIHAHFKDFVTAEQGRSGLDGNTYVGALVGEGLVDPAPCIKVMKEAGYDGYINFEYEGDKYTPREATIKGVRLIRDLIAGK